MRSYRSLSLFWGLALPIAGLALLLGGGTAFVVYQETTAALDSEMHNRVFSRSMNTAAELNYLLASPDPNAAARIEGLLAEPVESPGRLYAYVEDASGATLYSSGAITTELKRAIEESHGPTHAASHMTDPAETSDHTAMSPDGEATPSMGGMPGATGSTGTEMTGSTEMGAHASMPPDGEAAPSMDGMSGAMSSTAMEHMDHGPAVMVRFELPERGEVMDTAIPLDDGRVLHTGHTMGQMRQITDPVIIPLLASIGLGLVGSIALIALFAKLVSAPLRTLLGSVQRIESGAYGAAPSVSSFREVNELSHAVGAMSVGLAERELLRNENERLERELLRNENERLEEVDQLKSEFVALASHELRTPLTGIFGFSELLSDSEEITEEQRKWAAHIHGEAGRLAEIVEDLLDVASIESGDIELASDAVEFEDVIATVIESHAHSTDRHGFEVDCPGGVVVQGDGSRLIEVLGNLVENAIKYSPDGGSVWIRGEETDHALSVSVRDEGLGIPKHELPRLFTRFHRIPRPEHENIRSTGLGLYIVKQLVERMRGEVGVQSVEGDGSTFWFTVPLATPEREAAA